MKDNNYSMGEGILYNYPNLKAEIDNLKLDLEEMQEVMDIEVLGEMRRLEVVPMPLVEW